MSHLLLVDEGGGHGHDVAAICRRDGHQVALANGRPEVAIRMGDGAYDMVLLTVYAATREPAKWVQAIRAEPAFGDGPILALVDSVTIDDLYAMYEAGLTQATPVPYWLSALPTLIADALEPNGESLVRNRVADARSG